MPDVHLFIRDDIYDLWKKAFPNRGDASKWIYEMFVDYVAKNSNVEILKNNLLNKEEKAKQIQSEIDNIQKQISVASELEKAHKEKEEKYKRIFDQVNLTQLNNLKRSLIESFGINGEDLAQELAMEYLSEPADNRMPMEKFLRKKKTEGGYNG